MIATKQVFSNTTKLFFYSAPKPESNLYDTEKLTEYDPTKLERVRTSESGKGKKSPSKALHCPLVIDTEFTTIDEPLKQKGRDGISTQMKGISEDSPAVLFFHPSHADELNQARLSQGLLLCPVIKSEGHFVDYLNYCGLDASIHKVDENSLKNLPTFYLTLYAHFATAELCMVFTGGMLDEIKMMLHENLIQSRRRLIITTPKVDKKGNTRIIDSVEFKRHVLSINNKFFRISLRIIDTSAMHGIASYADIAANVGVKLAHKEDLDGLDKGKMLDIAREHPLKFNDYALGDLEVYEILKAYSGKWQGVHQALELESHYLSPKMTIGGTVKNLFLSALAKKLGIYDGVNPETGTKKPWTKTLTERVIGKYLTFTPSDMRQHFKSSKCLLTKVTGGRCRNNRPTDLVFKREIKNNRDTSLIYDIDISGCYGEGQRNQLFFLGCPVIFGIDHSRYTQYPKLRDVLKQLGVKVDLLCKKLKSDWDKPENWGDLIPGGWMMNISTTTTLKYGQDFFGSWVTKTGYGVDLMAKIIKDNIASDTENTDRNLIDFDEEAGTLKIFENEIHNGILTHDGLQWLFAIATPRQRNELLDNVCVQSGAFYPREDEIKPFSPESALDELDTIYENWEGKLTVEITKGNYGVMIINRDESCHKWVAFNLGDLIINDLLIQRKTAKITKGDKSPEDQLFKLCVNTLYGDMVSKFFATSNPIVGNNITARARALAWYMEKGFNGFQSITDGCGFLLNKVLKSKNKSLNGELTITTRDELISNENLSLKSLTDKQITCEWYENPKYPHPEDPKKEPKFLPKIWTGESEITLKEIDLIAFEHLRNEFPLVDILHMETTAIVVNKENLSVNYLPRVGQFSFEGKDIYHSAAFHGSANYIFQNPNTTTIKMRGYEIKKSHESWEVVGTNDGDDDIESFVKSERYGDKNNPGKDFMMQLLGGDINNIQRQSPAIKNGILKVGAFQEREETCKRQGVLPGDNYKSLMLFQEFSITQFTFKTYEQFMGWVKFIEKDKKNNQQSLESFFLNPDESVRFKDMVDWVGQAIKNDVVNPYKELDKSRNKVRASKKQKAYDTKNTINIYHPNQVDYQRVKKQLSGE